MFTKQEKAHLGKLLKKQRRSRRLTVVQATEKAELSYATITKIERGGNAKASTVIKYGRLIGLEVLKEIVEFRRKNDADYGKEKVVQFPYKVGDLNYQLEGKATEMPEYHRIIIVTLLPTLDYKKLTTKFQTFEKVAVLKTDVHETRKGERICKN